MEYRCFYDGDHRIYDNTKKEWTSAYDKVLYHTLILEYRSKMALKWNKLASPWKMLTDLESTSFVMCVHPISTYNPQISGYQAAVIGIVAY